MTGSGCCDDGEGDDDDIAAAADADVVDMTPLCRQRVQRLKSSDVSVLPRLAAAHDTSSHRSPGYRSGPTTSTCCSKLVVVVVVAAEAAADSLQLLPSTTLQAATIWGSRCSTPPPHIADSSSVAGP